MSIQETLGIRIRDYRKSKNLSQERFAGRCGLDRTYIFSIEKGKRNISVNVLLKIAKELDVDVCELIKDLDKV